MSRVLISGYHGYGNCGDEAILVAMIRNLRQRQPELDLVALSKLPEQTARLYGIRCINRFNLFSIIKELHQADLVISGGGSLLQDVTSNRSLYYYLGIILLARLMRKPVMLYANGIGPIKRSYNRSITRNIVSRVNCITLRDRESQTLLDSIGVEGPPVQITADPVLTMSPLPGERAESICKAEGIDTSKIMVGISVRPWKTGSDFYDKLAAIADSLAARGYEVLFMPLHQHDDLRAIRQVQALCTRKTHLLQGQYNAEEIMALIGQSRVFISMRLHGLVFAAVERVPMIGLVYDPKVQSFLDSLQQAGVSNLDSLETDLFLQLFDQVMQDRERIIAGIEEKMQSLRELASQNDKIVMEMLEMN